ncbi:MAG: ABC transporter substrate-binding protein [Candidatus Thermoplasmatota archaeon]|nr:ABC transporter substrate-binding protein [Candidatus Thermoplasmatota archaeon]
MAKDKLKILLVAISVAALLLMTMVNVSSNTLSAGGYQYGVAPASNSNSTFILGTTGEPMVVTLNPYGPYSFNYIGYGDSIIFSPLMYQMNGLPLYPGLATGYNYSNGGQTITFQLRSNAKYSNGAPFNSSDVKFTFNYIIAHPSIDSIGLNNLIKSISTPSSTQVVFNLNGTCYSSLYTLVSQPIFYPPQWQNITNPFNATMTDPIGTGPYMADSITSSGFLFERNPYFYGPAPNFDKIYFPEYSTGNGEITALESGAINWLTGEFNPGALEWQAQSSNHLYFTPASGTLEFFMNNCVWPLNNSNVRTAIRDIFNFSELAAESLQSPIYNYFPPSLNDYMSSSLLAKYPNGVVFKQNDTAAANLMEKAGFHRGSDGYWQAANGTEITLQITGNGGAANVMEMASTIEGWLNSFGIHANIYGPAAATFFNNLYLGHYDTGIPFFTDIINPLTGLIPAYSGKYYVPVGHYTYANYERYNNTTVTNLLTVASHEVNMTQQINTIAEVENILINQTPSFPIVTAISQNELITTGLTNVNETLLEHILYSPVFGPISSIAVALMTMGFSSSTTTPPKAPSAFGVYDYVAIGVVIAVAIAVSSIYFIRRGKNKNQ